MATRARPGFPCWMVALLAIDGKQYVYAVRAPDDALPADLFWSAYHHHEDSRLPRVSASFDTAEIWQPREREHAAEPGDREHTGPE